MPGIRPMQLVMMVMVSYGATFADWTDCPAPCQCKWSSGKKTALCKDVGFTEIPSVLNADMQVLDLSSNSIRHLPEDSFKSVGLLNLQRIFLRGCGIRNVHKDAFRELKILIELDLSDNLIGSIHQETFHGNERLRVLYLNGNPLTELKEAQFPVLQHLRTIELQHCQIKRIHRDAFLHLSSLETLSLNGNLLKQLSETVFLPISKLKTLSLDGNPWVCDCQLRSFRNWFVSSNLYSHPLTCIEPPTLSSTRWENIEPQEFACPPVVKINRNNVLEENGNNVTFICEITGDPEPEVSWYFNGHHIENFTDRIDENRTLLEVGRIWSMLSVSNVSENVAGDYTCEARNSRGQMSTNVSLVLPEVAVATTLSKSKSVYLVVVCVAISVTALLFTVGLTCCICHVRKVNGNGGRRDGKPIFKGSASFSDADKRLLDASISTTQAGSCEVLGGGSPSCQDLELIEQSLQSIPLAAVCDQQPVHITIESHDPGVSVYPPPPEFSTSILPSVSGFGNIFISVSVSQDPHEQESRYPDLLDLKHRQKQNVSVGTADLQQHQMPAASYYATMPRKNRFKDPNNSHYYHHHTMKSAGTPHYDNMGPRITATGSCTNLSALSISGGSSDEIPPPPPPPLCTGHTDYVAL